MKNIPKINPQRKVYKSYEILEAIMEFDVTALKIITICASQINREDRLAENEFMEYTFTYRALAEIMGYGDQNYSHLKEIASKMIVPIEIPTETGYEVVPFLEKAIYNEREGTLTLKFSKEMTPYLLNLNRYSSYEIWNILRIKSKHAFHIYEFLKAYEKIKVRTITLNDFKRRLLIEDKYERYTDLRAWVIEPAQKEIAQKTDITFDYRPIKTARKVTALEFTIHSKDSKDIIDIFPLKKLKESGPEEEIKKLIELFKTYDLFLSKQKGEFLYEKTKHMNLSKEDWEKITSSLKSKHKKGAIKKPVAYLMSDVESIIHEILNQNTLFGTMPEYELYVDPNLLEELAAKKDN